MNPTDELDRLAQLVADRPVPLGAVQGAVRRRRRLRLGAAATASALVLVAGAAVLTGGPLDRADAPVASDPSPSPSGHSAHTGSYPQDREDLRLGGPGEKLDPSGDDFAQVVREASADIPFASDDARTVSNQYEYDELRHEISYVSVGALRGFVANDAICSWANAWAAAVTSDDPAGKAAATEALQAASSWSAVTDLDRQLSGESRFWWLPLAQQAALGNDVRAMGHALAKNVMCLPALVPDLRQAVPASLRH